MNKASSRDNSICNGSKRVKLLSKRQFKLWAMVDKRGPDSHTKTCSEVVLEMCLQRILSKFDVGQARCVDKNICLSTNFDGNIASFYLIWKFIVSVHYAMFPLLVALVYWFWFFFQFVIKCIKMLNWVYMQNEY